MEDQQLSRLFDYTKFHIGLYSTLISGLFAVIAFATEHESCVLLPLVPFAKLTAGLILIAGAAGGAIASNIPNYPDFARFSQERLKVFGLDTFKYPARTHVEHFAFWCAVAVAAFAFLTIRP